MDSHKFWRPFESPVKSTNRGLAYPSSLVGTERRHLNNQYTFDLYNQQPRHIPAYLSANPQQLIISSTLRQHLCGNTIVNIRPNIDPHPNTSGDKQSRIIQRFVPIQPKPTKYEKRLKVMSKDRTEYKCLHPNCDKSFRFRSALENHRLVHSDERRFCCNQCGKRYKQLSGLYSHESVKHLGKTKKFVCDSCGEWFVDYRNLRIHEYNQHETDEFTKFIAKALEKSSTDSMCGHSSDDSNHSH